MKNTNHFKSLVILSVVMLAMSPVKTQACTGIVLKASDGSKIVARTIEWAATPMKTGYAVVPRGHKHQSLTPSGVDGITYKARYGYTGVWTEYETFIVDGINEAGLSVGLFFFPGYGKYQPYVPANKAKTLCDFHFVSWVLSSFNNIDAVKTAITQIDLVGLDPAIGTVHWRISEPNGRTVVLEFVDGKPCFYNNPLGVLTNAPGFEWHMTNLNNYVNLRTGSAAPYQMTDSISLSPFGGGSALLGIPGDYTPPSRFVRAAFMQASSPILPSGHDAALQAFRILNNFDIPIGMAYESGKAPVNFPGATQFITVTDQHSGKLYYRTMWNSDIRCIDTKAIDYAKVKYQTHLLDDDKVQPVTMVPIPLNVK